MIQHCSTKVAGESEFAASRGLHFVYAVQFVVALWNVGSASPWHPFNSPHCSKVSSKSRFHALSSLPQKESHALGLEGLH